MASQRTAPGLITDQLMHDFNITATTIGLITGVQFFVYTSLQIPMGILADRFGPNFFLIFGAVLAGVGTVLYSVGTHESVLFISRIFTGIGDATIWVNMMLILGQWFYKKEFVRLVGFAGMTGSLGFLLATVPFSAWIGLLGWRWAFFSLGLLVSLCGILLYMVLIKQTKKAFPQISHVVTEPVQREKTAGIVKRVFSSRQAWALFLCHFGVVGGYVGFISSWAVPYGMDLYEMSRSQASQLIMVGLVGAIIGAPFMSWIASMYESIKKPYIAVQSTVFTSWFMLDRKSTRLNSSHVKSSYAVFCLKKKKQERRSGFLRVRICISFRVGTSTRLAVRHYRIRRAISITFLFHTRGSRVLAVALDVYSQ